MDMEMRNRHTILVGGIFKKKTLARPCGRWEVG
jgi:hypothetical protein